VRVRVGAGFVRVRVGASYVRVRVGAGFVRVRVGAGLVRVGARLVRVGAGFVRVRVGAGFVRVRSGFVEYWGYSLGPRPPDPSHGQAHPLSAELVVLELPIQPSQLGALAAIDWTVFEEYELGPAPSSLDMVGCELPWVSCKVSMASSTTLNSCSHGIATSTDSTCKQQDI
jgi:hypothetical protein